MSATPIIDRLEPLPTPKRPVDWAGRAGVVTGLVFAAAYLLSITDLAPPLTRWVENAGAGYPGGLAFPLLFGMVVVVLGVFPIVAIHEAGHVLCGWLAGFTFASVRAGPLLIARNGKVSRYRGPNLWDGHANMVPRTLHPISAPSALLSIGGPAANFATGALMIAAAPRLGAWAAMFGWYSCVVAAINLLPFRTSNYGASDGLRLLRILTRPDWTAQSHALSMLMDAAERGVLPDEYPSDAIRAATAIAEDESATMTSFWLAYGWASCREDYADAERFLETSLRHSARGAPALRDLLLHDVVWFVGTIRRDPVLTERWSADLPPSSPYPGARIRVEAAVAVSRGDWDAAIGKLDEAERAIQPLITNAQAGELIRTSYERSRHQVRQLEREHGAPSIRGIVDAPTSIPAMKPPR